MTITSYGDNAQVPLFRADAYLPDQLVAGDLKIVSDFVSITGAGKVVRGSVLGQVVSGAAAAPVAGGSNTGNGVVSAVAKTAKTQPGDYVITFTGATAYGVTGPGGFTDTHSGAGAYAGTDIHFTFTAGATPMANNDVITVKVANAGVGVPAADSGNTGNGGITAVAKGATYKPGTYRVVFSGATAYDVYNPLGQHVGSKAAAGAFTCGDIGFTFTASSTPMAAGDVFTIKLSKGAGPFLLSALAAVDGSAAPTCILADDVDATTEDVLAGVYIMGEFNGAALTLGTGTTLAAATEALRKYKIFVKNAVLAADPS